MSEQNKKEYWIVRFFGITDEEFEEMTRLTTLPICYRKDIKAMCYDWHQHAKTELGICSIFLSNRHGKMKMEDRNRQVKYADGAGIVIGKVDNLINCNILQK